MAFKRVFERAFKSSIQIDHLKFDLKGESKEEFSRGIQKRHVANTNITPDSL